MAFVFRVENFGILPPSKSSYHLVDSFPKKVKIIIYSSIEIECPLSCMLFYMLINYSILFEKEKQTESVGM